MAQFAEKSLLKIIVKENGKGGVFSPTKKSKLFSASTRGYIKVSEKSMLKKKLSKKKVCIKKQAFLCRVLCCKWNFSHFNGTFTHHKSIRKKIIVKFIAILIASCFFPMGFFIFTTWYWTSLSHIARFFGASPIPCPSSIINFSFPSAPPAFALFHWFR